MSSSLMPYSSRSLTRATSHALDRTAALAAIAAEHVAAIGDVASEARRQVAQGALERRAIEMVVPEASTALELIDQQLAIAAVKRILRLEREL